MRGAPPPIESGESVAAEHTDQATGKPVESKPSGQPGPWRSRIVGEAEVDPKTLEAHPENWRGHPPAQQAALEQVLGDIGWVQRIVVNKRSGRCVDGHLRIERALARGEATVPVLYVDLDEDEERAILAALDPIAELAETNIEKRRALIAGISERRQELLRGVG